MLIHCLLVYAVLSVVDGAPIRGSPDACSDQHPRTNWAEVQQYLHRAIDEFDPASPLNITRGMAGLSDYIARETDILEGWQLDNNDCWFGYALPWLMISPHLLRTEETAQLEAEALSFLILCPWQFWILTSPWRPLEVLLAVSRMLNRANDVSEPCPALPETTVDAAAILLEHSLPPAPEDDVCQWLHRATRLARVSSDHQRYYVALGYGVYEAHAILERILKSHWLAAARTALRFTPLWEELLNLKPVHERGLLERKKGDIDDQLPQAGGSVQAVPPVPPAFAPAHSTSDRIDLIYAAQTVHEALEEHGIPYVIVAGTVIGAVRYHGLNPWEHDCDLCMDDRRHYDLLKIILRQFTEPQSSLLRQRGVRLIASVRKGYSHKFSLAEPRDFLELEESPSVTWGYPYGDVQECRGFAESSPWFGMRENWMVPRHLVVPRRKMLVHGVLMWGPARPEEYVTAYLAAMYGYIDDWKNICRGHRHLNESVMNCSALGSSYHHASPCPEVPSAFRGPVLARVLALHDVNFGSLDSIAVQCYRFGRSGEAAVYHTIDFEYVSDHTGKRCAGVTMARDLRGAYEFGPFLRFTGLPLHLGMQQIGMLSHDCE